MRGKKVQVNTVSQYPSIHWEKFFAKFSEIESLPVEKWKETHLLAYFCALYKKHYGVSYTFKFNSTAPTKSYEIFRLRSLIQMISSDPVIIKDYIDWFFEHKIIQKKKRITSLAFVVDANHASEYKFKKLAMNTKETIGRTTKLPPMYQQIIDEMKIACHTYGDLAFVAKGPSDEESEMLRRLKEKGLDLSVLDKVS